MKIHAVQTVAEMAVIPETAATPETVIASTAETALLSFGLFSLLILFACK